MLYRIPRSPGDDGYARPRRLAFVDNYRLITRRIKSNARRIATNAETLAARPRKRASACAPITSRLRDRGLAAEGSGMFLDLAYVVRPLLPPHGLRAAGDVAIFLLPAPDRQPNGRWPWAMPTRR